MMEDSLLDDQVLFDLTNKLTLDATDDYIQCRENQVLAMPDSISDEDISMKDYTEEEIEKADVLNTFSSIPKEYRDSTMKQRRKKSSNKQRIPQDEVPTNDSPGDTEKPISLIRSILEPETQGYMIGVARSNHKNNSKDTSVDQVMEPNSSLHTVYGKLNDKNVVIHNHFYNIIAGPGFVQGYDNSKEFNCYDNGDKNLQFFENLKKTLNYSLILVFGYFIVKQVIKDIGLEYHRLLIRENFQKDQCMEEYYVNKCDEYGQLPALKEECLEWKICMNEGNTVHIRSIFYSELAMQVFGRLLNESLNNIGGMNRIFLLVALSVWYLVNFTCGYVRGAHSEEKRKAEEDSHQFQDHSNMQLVRQQDGQTWIS